jgi:hypothetical protein
MSRACNTNWGEEYRIFVGKEKRPLKNHRCRREDNIKIDLKRNRMGW